MKLQSKPYNFNVRMEKGPRFKDDMRRIREHFPYSEPKASRSWIILESISTQAKILDAIKALDAGSVSGLIQLAFAGKKAQEESNE